MPLSHQHVHGVVSAYLAAHPEDAGSVAPVTAALDLSDDVTSRKEFGGHVTASAVLLTADARVLLVHHRALDRWLCPGGHLEPSDSDFSAAAARELMEETGLRADAFEAVGSTPLHIDVHPIPASDAKGEPEHRHFDFRMLFRVTGQGVLSPQQEEVMGVAWLPFTSIVDVVLRARVAALVDGGTDELNSVSVP
jgi:8-oxo-dGTP pyrophosphatase MutT (NUDIX family)